MENKNGVSNTDNSKVVMFETNVSFIVAHRLKELQKKYDINPSLVISQAFAYYARILKESREHKLYYFKKNFVRASALPVNMEHLPYSETLKKGEQGVSIKVLLNKETVPYLDFALQVTGQSVKNITALSINFLYDHDLHTSQNFRGKYKLGYPETIPITKFTSFHFLANPTYGFKNKMN